MYILLYASLVRSLFANDSLGVRTLLTMYLAFCIEAKFQESRNKLGVKIKTGSLSVLFYNVTVVSIDGFDA